MLGPCSSWSMLKKSLTFCLRGDSPSAKRGSPRAAVPWLLAKGGRAKSFLLVHTGGAVRTQPSPTWILLALVLGHFFFSLFPSRNLSSSQICLSVLFIFFLYFPCFCLFLLYFRRFLLLYFPFHSLLEKFFFLRAFLFIF